MYLQYQVYFFFFFLDFSSSFYATKERNIFKPTKQRKCYVKGSKNQFFVEKYEFLNFLLPELKKYPPRKKSLPVPGDSPKIFSPFFLPGELPENSLPEKLSPKALPPRGASPQFSPLLYFGTRKIIFQLSSRNKFLIKFI